jgi:hypothetical protein
MSGISQLPDRLLFPLRFDAWFATLDLEAEVTA